MRSYPIMSRSSVVLVVAATLVHAVPATAGPFTDYLVQPPKLAAPERGSVAGTLANLAFEPGGMSRGDFALPIPIGLPSERGAPLANVLPSYSPDSGQSEWGMGWRVDLSIRRFAVVGDIDPAGDEFVSPWGRLAQGADGRYHALGNPAAISLQRIGDGWQGVNGEGTTFVFAAADVVAGGHAWMLSRVDSALGDTTTLTYERNASGRPFVTAVEWGGRAAQRQYRLELAYQPLAIALDDYRAGSRLSLDRRVHEVRVLARSTASGSFEIAATYQLDYLQSPRSAAFYLTGVTKTHRSGEREPTQRYDYDLGDTTIASAALADVPALDPLLAARGANTLQPDKALVLDVDEDGEVDFEIAKDQALVRLHGGAVTTEALPTNPASFALCRPSVSTLNLPRVLARMTPEATEPQVFRTIGNAMTGRSRVLVCNREGVRLSDQQIPGASWELGPNTHLVDLNHDHRPDLVRIFSRGYQVVENTSGPAGYSFVTHPMRALAEAFTPDSSWVHDMNGDGQADLVLRFPSAVLVWHGLGQLRFASTAKTLLAKTPSGATVTDLSQRQLTFLDVNRDGLTDVLATKGRLISLFINDGRQLKEVIVPGFAAISWDFGAPVVADITGSGNFAVMVAQGVHAKAIELMTPATGLLVAAHDGKGTDVTFAYKRTAATAGIGQRPVVLDQLTIASSGYDTVSYHYGYGAPVLHTASRHLIGFASVDKRSPVVTEHVEFLHDDDVAGVRSLVERTDDRTPGVFAFTREAYDDEDFDGARWLRPALVETGYRDAGGTVRLATTTHYTTYEREFCATVITKSSPSGQLVATSALASVAAIPDELHCLTRSHNLFGTHADASRDFSYLASFARNDLGQLTRVTQFGASMAPLVLQDVAYDAEHRIASASAPGRGTTTPSYDAAGRLTAITAPIGIATRADDLDPVTDALFALNTARPGAPVTAFFEYDERERLRASWDDVSGAGPAQPLASYAYRDPTTTMPGRIDGASLVDTVTGTTRRAVTLVGADGAPLVAGTWLGDHYALDRSSITVRNTLTRRSSFVGTLTDAALSAMTSADLRALGTPLAETVEAGFGYPIQATTTQQAGVVGTVTTELALGATELVTRVHQPGGFTAESAVDAAGNLVRKTDEHGVVHRYAYDALGRLVHIDTPDGGHTLAFDDFARPARVTRDGLGAVIYSYDANTGLPSRTQRVDASGAVIDTSDVAYDTIGRPVQATQTAAGEVSHVTFDYDGGLGGTTAAGQLGRLTRVRGDGWERRELFDPLGRSYEQRLSLDGWRDVTRDQTFRADGSVASHTLTIADASGAVRFSSTQETVLDSLGRVAALEVDGAVLYTLSYDAEGRLARADFTSGEAITFDHDAVTHHPRGYQIEAPSSTGGTHWDRDPRGLVSAETYVHGATTTRRDYGYDGRGQLINATTPTDVASYTYTASGLPDTISDTASARSVHRVGNTLTVDGITYRWDAAGRVTAKGEWTFDYGASGQIAHARRPGRQIDFVYDDANQRLLKRVDGVPVRAEVAGGVLTEDHFIELVTIGGVVAGVLDNGTFTALLTDPRGTPFAGPDGTPGLASPYGVRTSHLGLAEVIDFARLGWDPDLDVVRMGVRDYDSRLGQFLTPDPLYFTDLEKCQASPLQCSLYGYAAGNPISFVDPTGMEFAEWFERQVAVSETAGAGTAASGLTLTIVAPVVVAYALAEWTGGPFDWQSAASKLAAGGAATGIGMAAIAGAASAPPPPDDPRKATAAAATAVVEDELAQRQREVLGNTLDVALDLPLGTTAALMGAQPVLKATTLYKRPSGATTRAQRSSVQGQDCVKCGAEGGKRYAGHKKALVEEHYETGAIDKNRMRALTAVQPECPHCSNKEGAAMSAYSKEKKKEIERARDVSP